MLFPRQSRINYYSKKLGIVIKVIKVIKPLDVEQVIIQQIQVPAA
jgi:hypothetical protein